MNPEMTFEELQGYLDGCIRSWRLKRDEAPTADVEQMAIYYVDAFQSVRASVFGEILAP